LYADVAGTIYRLSLVGGERAYVTGIGNPGDIAVDWVTQNVYFVQKSAVQTIRVCNLDEQSFAVVTYVEHGYSVTKLAVDPSAG
jgi:hypothetical protein